MNLSTWIRAGMSDYQLLHYNIATLERSYESMISRGKYSPITEARIIILKKKIPNPDKYKYLQYE